MIDGAISVGVTQKVVFAKHHSYDAPDLHGNPKKRERKEYQCLGAIALKIFKIREEG